jgi:phage-related minor tail protein
MADTKTSVAIQASVQGLASIQGLNKGLGGLATQAKTTGGALGRLRGAAGGAVTALRGILPVIGVAGVAAFAKSNLDAADAMSKLSLRTGIAAPELDKFRKVAELSDTSIESLSRAFPVLSKNVKDATEKGTGPAARAFEQLGIQLANADGSLRSTDDIMLQVSDAFAGMADGTEKAALASQIFGGRLGSELIPLLNSGGDAVRNMSTSMTQEFADSAAVFNDRLENMQEKLGDLGVRMTIALLPALDALVAGVESLIQGFSQLPGPLQTIIAGLAGISAVALVFSPIISAVTALGPLIGSLIGLLTGGGGLAAAIAAVFTGPVGWIALLVAAGVAIYTFRDQIGDALKAIGQFFVDGFKFIGDILKDAAQAYMDFYVKPVLGFAQNAWDGIVNIFNRLPDAIKAPFIAAGRMIQSVWNGILTFVANSLNSFIQKVNAAINLARNIGVNIPTIQEVPVTRNPQQSAPSFAGGGYTGDGPRVGGIDGKGGFPAILHPRERVIDLTARNGNVAMQPAQINIQTGPVMQADGQNWVTVADLQRAMRATEAATMARLRTYAGRRAVGVA